jgi:hypothetical protein
MFIIIVFIAHILAIPPSDFSDDDIKDLELIKVLIGLNKATGIAIGAKQPLLSNRDENEIIDIIRSRIEFLIERPIQYMEENLPLMEKLENSYDSALRDKCNIYIKNNIIKNVFQKRQDYLKRKIMEEIVNYGLDHDYDMDKLYDFIKDDDKWI